MQRNTPQIAYMYTKARSEFGKQVRFEDAKSSLVHELAPNDIEKQKNIMINPSIARFDTHPMMYVSHFFLLYLFLFCWLGCNYLLIYKLVYSLSLSVSLQVDSFRQYRATSHGKYTHVTQRGRVAKRCRLQGSGV
jgi:hypothetical protein